MLPNWGWASHTRGLARLPAAEEKPARGRGPGEGNIGNSTLTRTRSASQVKSTHRCPPAPVSDWRARRTASVAGLSARLPRCAALLLPCAAHRGLFVSPARHPHTRSAWRSLASTPPAAHHPPFPIHHSLSLSSPSAPFPPKSSVWAIRLSRRHPSQHPLRLPLRYTRIRTHHPTLLSISLSLFEATRLASLPILTASIPSHTARAPLLTTLTPALFVIATRLRITTAA